MTAATARTATTTNMTTIAIPAAAPPDSPPLTSSDSPTNGFTLTYPYVRVNSSWTLFRVIKSQINLL